MKVLFTSHWYPNAKSKNGAFIAKHFELIQEHFEVDLITVNIHSGKEIFKKEVHQIEPFHTEIEISSRFWKFIYLFYFLQKLLVWKTVLQTIKNKKYDIIHANVTHPNGVMAEYLSSQTNTPYLISEHHSQFKRYFHSMITRRAYRKALEKAQYILPVSKQLQEIISELVPTTPQEVVPNVISKKNFFPHPPQNNKQPTAIAIGTWNDSKYNTKLPKLMVEALNSYAEKHQQNIQLIHCGYCTIKEELLALCGTFLTIDFKGLQDPAAINAFLNQSDFFMHGTRSETFCVVGVEAQMAGRPILISNIDPIPEVTIPEGRVLVENKLEAWVKGIETILKSDYSPEEISQAANALHSPQIIIDKLKKVYPKA